MERASRELVDRGIATLRYHFPYVEAGRRAPNPPGVLVATVRAALERAAELEAELPLFAGGKSLGGRMTSTAASQRDLPRVAGLVFYGFPLHAAGRSGLERAEHLRGIELPMLFLQGERDKLAPLDEMETLVRELGSRAHLHVVEGGDHSFHVLKRSGRSDDEVQVELAEAFVSWAPRSQPLR